MLSRLLTALWQFQTLCLAVPPGEAALVSLEQLSIVSGRTMRCFLFGSLLDGQQCYRRGSASAIMPLHYVLQLPDSRIPCFVLSDDVSSSLDILASVPLSDERCSKA